MIFPLTACKPIDEVLALFRNGPKIEGKLSTSHEETAHLPGYMAGDTELPHVLHEGKLWFHNVFLARLYHERQSADLGGHLVNPADVETTNIGGYLFFRLVKLV